MAGYEMTQIQIEAARNPWRSTWDILRAMEAAQALADGEIEAASVVPILPASGRQGYFTMAPEVIQPLRYAAGGR